MRKALFLIGGIAYKNVLYALNDLYSITDLLTFCQYKFGVVREIPTNRYRDKTSVLSIFDLVLGTKLSDPVKLRFGYLLRKSIKKCIKNELALAKDMKTTVIAHSQGTIEALITGMNVDTLILCNSPLGWCSPVGRNQMRTLVSRWPWSKPKAKCRRLIYLYSSEDLVSCFPPKEKDMKDYVSYEDILYINIKGPHDFIHALKYIHENNLLA